MIILFHHSMTTITIEITDINDHDPVFDLDMFTISPIPEVRTTFVNIAFTKPYPA